MQTLTDNQILEKLEKVAQSRQFEKNLREVLTELSEMELNEFQEIVIEYLTEIYSYYCLSNTTKYRKGKIIVEYRQALNKYTFLGLVDGFQQILPEDWDVEA